MAVEPVHYGLIRLMSFICAELLALKGCVRNTPMSLEEVQSAKSRRSAVG